jgi:hypothetical protein
MGRAGDLLDALSISFTTSKSIQTSSSKKIIFFHNFLAFLLLLSS